jgi:hypothetical protein
MIAPLAAARLRSMMSANEAVRAPCLIVRIPPAAGTLGAPLRSRRLPKAKHVFPYPLLSSLVGSSSCAGESALCHSAAGAVVSPHLVSSYEDPNQQVAAVSAEDL